MSAGEGARHAFRWSRLVALLPVVIALAVGATFFWGLGNSDGRLPSALLEKPIPEFSLPPIEGRENGLSSADLRGQVSLVNVWASWCVPCRAEMPLLVELEETGRVPIYGINYKDDPKAALEFLAELGDPYRRIGADRSGRVAIDWGVYGIPETFVIDAAGRIAHKHVGAVDRRALEQEILPVVDRLMEAAR
ncbi:MAG TPA: DsbE family thiol:disulfide interchange protein [Paracoccaceae bacterium]|nr:DsbE family thiol:disulfide interchange protein [Paracoccaceae bacterium]